MTLLRMALFLCGGLLLLACGDGRGSIEDRLAGLEAEREAFMARVEAVEDASLREQLDRLASIVFWMREAEINSERPPDTVAYAHDRLAVLDDYEDIDALARNFAGGIIATTEARYRPQDTSVTLPFDYPFEQSLVWHTATLADGTRLLVTDDIEAVRPYADADGTRLPGGANEAAPREPDGVGVVHQYMQATRLTTHLLGQVGTDIPPVQRLEGRLQVELPAQIHRVGFSAGEVGRTREAGGYKIRLEALDGHRVQVSVKLPVPVDDDADDPLDDRVVLIARDASGRTLDDSGSSSGPPGGVKELQGVLDALLVEVEKGKVIDEAALEARVEARERALVQAHGDAVFRGKTFRGTVAELDVVVIDPAGSRTREFPLSLEPMYFDVPRDTEALLPFPVDGTIYDHDLAETLDGGIPDEIEPAALADAITIRRRDLVGVGGDARLMVEFQYPNVVSNRFVSPFRRYGEALEVTFFDAAGAPIPMPEDEDAREALYRFTVDRLEYSPDRFPVPPVRVAGRLEVNLQPAIRRRWVEATQLPEGAELSGNAYFKPPAYRNEPETRVFAQDRNGRYLRQLTELRYSYRDAAPRDAYYFYGEPVRILLLELEQDRSRPPAEYAFDVDLTAE